MKKFLRDFKGASSIEYAIIAALISVFIIIGVSMVGDQINNTYSSIGSQIKATEK